MPFSDVTTHNLFPTPVFIASLPEAVSQPLNATLTEMILAKAATEKSTQITNIGGWQSDTRIMEWGGAPVATIVHALKEIIDQATLNLHRDPLNTPVPWKVFGWANVNSKSHLNVVHTHPGAYWSASYYVKVEDANDVGGEFQIIDPRGTMPIMYQPQLRIGIEGFQSCGGHELIKPKAGQAILFPSWLPHAVMPHTGEEPRISLAFNFAV